MAAVHWEIPVGKGNDKKTTLVQIGTIMIGNGVTAEEAVLDAQTRSGVTRYEVFPEENYVALYGKYEAQPASPVPG